MLKRDLTDYLQDILTSIEDVEDFVAGMEYKEFEKDRKTQLAVLKSIEIIGEASRNIPKNFRDKHAEIPWKKIVGMRDKLVHDYVGVDLPTVWDTATKNIPPLKEIIRAML